MTETYLMPVSKTIEILKQDLPTLFEEDISYDIYARDIYFTDPVNTFEGKFNYRIIFWTLRFHGGLFFSDLHFDLHEVYPSAPGSAPESILADWTVRGTLRVPWRAKVFFNGQSTYSLDKRGLIYRHEDTWDRSPKAILKQFFRPGDSAKAIENPD